MTQREQLKELIDKGNGYLSCRDAARFGISPQVVSLYARERGLVRETRGLYRDPDSWEDPLYALQFRYPKLVFSHEAALFLLGLSEREPASVTATVATGTGLGHPRARGRKGVQGQGRPSDARGRDGGDPLRPSRAVLRPRADPCGPSAQPDDGRSSGAARRPQGLRALAPAQYPPSHALCPRVLGRAHARHLPGGAPIDRPARASSWTASRTSLAATARRPKLPCVSMPWSGFSTASHARRGGSASL